MPARLPARPGHAVDSERIHIRLLVDEGLVAAHSQGASNRYFRVKNADAHAARFERCRGLAGTRRSGKMVREPYRRLKVCSVLLHHLAGELGVCLLMR
jgi:hypothetical protein